MRDRMAVVVAWRALVMQALSGASEADSDVRERLPSHALNKSFDVPPDLLPTWCERMVPRESA